MRKKSKLKGMRLGQTIVAEREYVESDSERMQARRKVHRKQRTSVVIVILMLVVLGLMAYIGIKEVTKEYVSNVTEVETYPVTAEIVDEDGRGQITARVREYVGQLEKDFQEQGYKVTKVVLPTGVSRSLYVDLEGRTGYLKVNIDRGAGVTVEDAVRMLKYVDSNGLSPEYIDVRIDGKAYYK